MPDLDITQDRQHRLDKLEAFLADKPDDIRQLALEFPPFDAYIWRGAQVWIVGYGEGDHLLVSPLPPGQDVDDRLDKAFGLCARHLRN